MSADPAAAPSGVVTFLFTDVEGSTCRWEKTRMAMPAALAAHDGVAFGIEGTTVFVSDPATVWLRRSRRRCPR